MSQWIKILEDLLVDDEPFWKERQSIPPDRKGCSMDNDWSVSPSELEHGIPSGDLVVQGFRGAAPVTVEIADHAQNRMRERDIDQSEVLHVLANGASSHKRMKSNGRFGVAAITAKGRRHGRLRVIYTRPTDEVVRVITSFRE